jgi:hypothetical protein
MPGCSREPPVLHFVIPSGFCGAIRIVPGSPNASAPEAVGGRLIFRIPAGGVLNVKSDAPFVAWHQTTAEYTDGTALLADIQVFAAEDSGHRVSKDTVALWALYDSKDGSAWYYVGPKAEAMNAAYNPLEVKPGQRYGKAGDGK